MRKFLIILLGFLISITASAAGYLSSKTRTTRNKTSISSTVLLSSAVRHSGGPTYVDPFDDYWVFDGDYDWLSILIGGVDVFPDETNTKISFIVGTSESHVGVKFIAVAGSSSPRTRSWAAIANNDNAYFRSYSNGMNVQKDVYKIDYTPSDAKSVFGGHRVTNAIDSGYSDLSLYAIADNFAATTVTKNHVANINYIVPTGPFAIGADVGGGSKFIGKIYFVAVYSGINSITQDNIEDIYNSDAHPVDFSPTFYIDFHQAVGETYTSEIGDLELTVNGSPTKGP